MVWPLWGGGEIRNFNLLKETARHHEVHLLCFLRGAADREHFAALEPYCKSIHGIELKRSRVRKVTDAARSWVGSKPYMLYQYTDAGMARALADTVREKRIDVVHAHFLHVGQYFSDKGEAAFVYDAHNLEHVLWDRMRVTQRNPLVRAFCGVQSKRFIDWQRRVAAGADKVVTLSDDDADEYRRIAPGVDVATVPNGADIDFFAPREGTVEENSILYFGNLEWLPQEEAITFFCRETLPLIHRSVPEARLYIAGRGASPTLRALASDRVVITGFVDDIRDAIARAAVVVLPLRVGAGTKHRVFQTLAMKKALVSSTVGAEGIRLEHGATAMIADAPEEFAEHVVALLRDGELRHRLGENGRRLVEDEYNWGLNYEKLEQIFQAVAGSR